MRFTLKYFTLCGRLQLGWHKALETMANLVFGRGSEYAIVVQHAHLNEHPADRTKLVRTCMLTAAAV